MSITLFIMPDNITINGKGCSFIFVVVKAFFQVDTVDEDAMIAVLYVCFWKNLCGYGKLCSEAHKNNIRFGAYRPEDGTEEGSSTSNYYYQA